jgi:hypothetical protein
MSTVAIAGQVFHFGMALYQQADTKLLQTNPTIAVGDFKASVNGGPLTDMDNTPAVVPAGGVRVEMVLSAAETTAAGAGGHINIYWEDALGTQWCSGMALVFVHAAESAGVGDAMTLTGAYDDAKTAAAPGEAMTLTGAYDAAKTAAQAGNQMALTPAAQTNLVATVAAAIWNRALTALTTVGSIGKYIWDKLALITSGSVTVTTPIVAGGNVTTYRGDDYHDTEGRALDWQEATFPPLTGLTITVIIQNVVQFTGSVPAVDTARLELTGTQSAAIPAGRHRFQVLASGPGIVGHLTLVEASWVSRLRAEV